MVLYQGCFVTLICQLRVGEPDRSLLCNTLSFRKKTAFPVGEFRIFSAFLRMGMALECLHLPRATWIP